MSDDTPGDNDAVGALRLAIADKLQLAEQHQDREQKDEAARLLVEVVRLQDQLSGEEADETLEVRDHIAQRLFDAARYAEAVELDDGTLARLQFSPSFSGPADERTVATRHRLACSCVALGNLSDGIEQHLVNLRRWERSDGMQLASCRTYAALAEGFGRMNEPDEAAQMEGKWMSVSRQWARAAPSVAPGNREIRTELTAGILALEAHRFGAARGHFQRCQTILGSSDLEAFVCGLWLQRCQKVEHPHLARRVRASFSAPSTVFQERDIDIIYLASRSVTEARSRKDSHISASEAKQAETQGVAAEIGNPAQ